MLVPDELEAAREEMCCERIGRKTLGILHLNKSKVDQIVAFR